jgi:DNA polymerase I-like protein with 3'-5' exonuclease and polymerase domains
MMEVFHLDQDIHDHTACTIWNIDLDYVSLVKANIEAGFAGEAEIEWLKNFKQQMRLPAKVLGFRILYEEVDSKYAPQGLQTQILIEGGPHWEVDDCAKLIADWYATYPKIKELMERQYQRARRWEMVWDAFGRPRLVPEVRSTFKRIRGEGLRKAGNHIVQSSAQGTIKLAMAASLPLCDLFNAWPLLQIHDELIFEIDKSQAKDFAHIQTGIMEQATPLSIPIKSSSDIAERWSDLK